METIPRGVLEGVLRVRSVLVATDIELLRGKSVVAAIDFRLTRIFPTNAAPDRRPEHVVAADPRGRFHQVHHRAGNPDGSYEADSSGYWEQIIQALEPAGEILFLGHGKGKANASHHWVSYVEKHRKDLAAKIVADVRIDIDDLDDAQVLRLAQYFFGEQPVRASGEGAS